VVVPSRLMVSDVDTMLRACVAGVGIAQVMALGSAGLRRSGELEELLPDWPDERFPLHAIYPMRRHRTAKVRAFHRVLHGAARRAQGPELDRCPADQGFPIDVESLTGNERRPVRHQSGNGGGDLLPDPGPLSQRRYRRLHDRLPRGRRPSKPALLLLHGFPSSGHMFRDLIPLLAERFHLVAPTCRLRSVGEQAGRRLHSHLRRARECGRPLRRGDRAGDLGALRLRLRRATGFRIAMAHPQREVRQGEAHAKQMRDHLPFGGNCYSGFIAAREGAGVVG
jgi:hypothetical protein